MQLAVVLICFLSAAASSLAQVEDTTGKTYLGYKVARDVTSYRNLLIDASQIAALAKAKQWPSANAIYVNGKNAQGRAGLRKLQAVATAVRTNEGYYNLHKKFYGANYIEGAYLRSKALTAGVGLQKTLVAIQWILISFIAHELDVAKGVIATNPELALTEIDDAFGLWYGYPAQAEGVYKHATIVQQWLPCAGNIVQPTANALKAMQAAAKAKNQKAFNAQYSLFFDKLIPTVYLRSVLYSTRRRNLDWQKRALGYMWIIRPHLKGAANAKKLVTILSLNKLPLQSQVEGLLKAIAAQQGLTVKTAGFC